MMKEIKLSPSMMCADFGDLKSVITKLEDGGAQMLHIDVMDAHFVPNLSMGVPVIRSISEMAKLPLDIHLMVEDPEAVLKLFPPDIFSGSIVSFHIESTKYPYRLIKFIRDLGASVSVAVNPLSSAKLIEPLLDRIDMILVLTVDPGFAGSEFIPEAISKIEYCRELIEKKRLNIDIEVDGNINEQTVPLLLKAGANVFVAGSSSVFKDKAKIKESTREFVNYIRRNNHEK